MIEIPTPEKDEHMGTRRIRIIKQGTVTNRPQAQAATVPGEKPAKDPMAELIRSVSGWVAEFKERRRLDPRIAIQALFK